jgi:uncharacterized membrane protein
MSARAPVALPDPIAFDFQLITYSGATDTHVMDINDSGQMVGWATLQGLPDQAFVRAPRGTFHNIAYPGTTADVASGINSKGDISGYYLDGGRTHGFIFTLGRFTDVTYPNAYGTTPYGVNNSEEVVGFFVPAQSGGYNAFIRDKSGAYTSFCGPSGVPVIANKINERGQIVGYGGTHGFLRARDGNFQWIDYPGAVSSFALGINNEGVIVGYYFDGNVYSGFLRDVTGTFWPISYANSSLVQVVAINDDGDIVGTFTDPDTGKFKSFLAKTRELPTTAP